MRASRAGRAACVALLLAAPAAANGLRADVEALTAPAMEGRLAGTPGAQAAEDHVAEAFAGIGLAPAGDGGGWFEAFEFTADIREGPGNRLNLDGTAAALGRDWQPLAFSPSVEVADSPVVFAGFGIVAPAEGGAPAVDAYDGQDLAGAWALVWRGVPPGLDADARARLQRFAGLRHKLSAARGAGAVGLIVAPAPGVEYGDDLADPGFEPAAGEAPLPALAIDAALGERLLGTVPAETVEAALGGVAMAPVPLGARVAATLDLVPERRTARNVLGRLDLGGAGPPVVVGAHLDHLGRGEPSTSLARPDEAGEIHPGADDNASGVAALIEAARLLAAERAAGRLAGARDIVFAAWSGEELGLLGAAHHVRGGGGAAAYVNLDMVGRLRDRVTLFGLGSSPGWPALVEVANAGPALPIDAAPEIWLPSDATEFYRAGVPILAVFTGAHADYHSPRDTADRLNYPGLGRIARFTAALAAAAAAAPEPPAYVAVAEPPPLGRRGAVTLGTIPDYAGAEGPGVALSGAVAGGPAAAAGVEAGDRITGLAGEEIADIYDLMRVLNGLIPGREVALEVLRDGARRTLAIVPAARADR